MQTGPSVSRGGDTEGKVRTLKIQCLNICSLRKNLDQFILQLLDKSTDIIVLTETWIYPHEEGLFRVPGYKSFFFSNATYRSGGTALFVKDTITCHQIDTNYSSCDACLVELVIEGYTIQILGVYRSPTRSVSDLDEYIKN